MIPATQPIHRPQGAKLLAVTQEAEQQHMHRDQLIELLHHGDLLVANDAATLPASLHGIHDRTGEEIEVRLAGRRSLAFEDVREFTAVLFGAGDFRTLTEDRPAPPPVRSGDSLTLGPLRATILRSLGHPRLITLAFAGSPEEIWAGIARHGRPIQYAHVREPLALWDVWTQVASHPVAFEPPSAGFLLDWNLLSELKRKGVGFATLSHAAGLSSTGDPVLDRRLPLDEPYRIPEATVRAIRRTQAGPGRVIALGTTVTRAVEHAASRGEIQPGEGIATQRLGPATQLRAIDAILSGVHGQGESHYELLRAFAPDAVLHQMTRGLESHGYRNHEFGDSVFLERQGGAGAPN